jgi:hypothetical protein
MSEPTQEQIDGVFAALGIAFPLRNEITIATALVEARLTLALATQRAEAAEAERDVWKALLDSADCSARDGLNLLHCRHDAKCTVCSLRAECDALRTVDDAMVERATKALYEDSTGLDWDERSADMEKICRDSARLAIDAALAVQPTTGEGR